MKTKDVELIPGISPHWLRIDEIREGDEGLIDASAPERAAVADLLDLGDLSKLSLRYSLHRLGQGRIGLKGRLTAKLTQTCVVSLEPLPQELDVPIEVAFWPGSQVRDMEKAAAEDPASQGILDWPELILDGKIDLGPVLYEGLATTLDPYPRAEGVDFAWSDQDGAEARPPNPSGPFAALARLKQP
ncbi:MAG TPA: DUF177 domain-containing protein [Methyloceanibacter sp.]|nr:DUF177 domain-containing protein [Methyloceanibacter sp.]